MRLTKKLFAPAAALCLVAASVVAAQDQQGQQSSTTSSSASGSQAGSNSGALGMVSDAVGIRRYQLGPGDVVELRVYNDTTLTGKYTVDVDGNIDIPLVGAIPAKCRTDLQLKEDVLAGLKKYLKNPSISLSVAERNSRPMATVFGAVRAPTRVQMNRRVRLIELLAVAGGATEQASADIQIYHTEPIMCPTEEDMVVLESEKKTEDAIGVPFNVYDISDVKAGKQNANPYIRPGDIIIVQEAFPIFVTGAVVQPSNLYLRNDMTLFRAIAQVGGLRKDAKTDKVYIYRKNKEGKAADPIIVNFDAIRKNKAQDVPLEPYDIVEVRDASPWSAAMLPKTLLGIATGAAQQVVSAGSVRIIN